MWLIDSSIGRKFIMSVSGTALVLFLLFHGCMNLALVFSEEAYNTICRLLGANWYAVLGSMLIALLVLVHFCYGIYLTILNRRARGNDRYAVSGKKEGVTWESENMLVLGLVVFFFLLLHLYNFWFKMQFAELTGIHTGAFDPQDGAAYVKALFTTPVSGQIYCVLYLIWFCVLWLHLNHGVGSAMTSMGLNNETWQPRVKVISTVVATLVILPFTIVVLYYFGVGIGQML